MDSSNLDIDTLIEQLHDKNLARPDDQFKAAIALGTLEDDASQSMIVDELIKALQPDHQALTRAHAVQSLARLQDERALQPLVAALKDDYQLVRAYAAGAIPVFKDPSTIPPLLDTFKNDSFYGARAAATAALGYLSKECSQDDARVREAIAILEIYREEERKKKERSNERVMRELYTALTSEEAVEAAERLEELLLESKNALEESEQEKHILQEQLDIARRKLQDLSGKQ